MEVGLMRAAGVRRGRGGFGTGWERMKIVLARSATRTMRQSVSRSGAEKRAGPRKRQTARLKERVAAA